MNIWPMLDKPTYDDVSHVSLPFLRQTGAF